MNEPNGSGNGDGYEEAPEPGAYEDEAPEGEGAVHEPDPHE